jgi:hypothetical protein
VVWYCYFMRRFGLLIAVSLIGAGGFCQAQELSEGDRSYALSALHASRKQVLDATTGLSKAQWNFKPSPEAWSIAEISEHLVLVENGISQLIAGALKSPATPEKKAATPREMDGKILSAVPQRNQKVQAAEAFKPSGKFKDGKAAVLAFQAARDRNLETIRTTKDALRAHFAKNPVFGDLDALQWYLFMSAHSERHVNQMLEVKASQAFPKK